MNVKFGIEVALMSFNRVDGDKQLLGNFLPIFTLGKKRQDFMLTLGEVKISSDEGTGADPRRQCRILAKPDKTPSILDIAA